MNNAPTATGIMIKPAPLAPRIAIIGLAPAGGWTVLVSIIKNIANPTPNPILRLEIPNIANTKTPEKAEIMWPKKTFFGWAKGLSWTAITKTMLAPNGGINHKLLSSKELMYASAEMHKNAPNPEIILFFTQSAYLKTIELCAYLFPWTTSKKINKYYCSNNFIGIWFL